MGLVVDDLWTPRQPLPGRRVLQAVAERCGKLWRIADFARRVHVAYNAKLRSTLGRALLDEGRVELNTRLLRKHPGQLVGTLVHELAHVAVHLRYGKVPPHGAHFKVYMRAAGRSAKATHSLPTGHLKRRGRYLYLHRCVDCGYSFIARSLRRNVYCTACGPEMSWDIFRTFATPQGRALLAKLRAPKGSPK